ncbi:MAG TPA: putative manganese-dependent inorganic diphosphatase [Verrucomicrobiota bacterium]|nr:putative manganese-dependent inorganic diphosphatase [Verrucomicrobiota bacterium]
MSEVLVIGHRNPDPDAICSAIGYAEFKRRTGMRDVVAARCGDTNERIDFILKTFAVPPPRFVADVAPRVRDVMQTNVVTVAPGSTVVEALTLMDSANIRVLPVAGEDRRVQGLVSVFKASKFFFPSATRAFDSRRVVSSPRGLARTLRGKLLCGFDPDREDDLILMVAAMSVDSLAKRMAAYPREKLVVVVGDRTDAQELAVRERVRALIVTGGLPVSDALAAAAQANEVSLILSPHDSATTAMLCRAAIPVRHVLDEHFLSFREDEPLIRVRDVAANSGFQAFPVLAEDGRMVGVLSKSDLLRKVDRRLILVDHNELSQAVSGADQVEILEIIDHHRLGNLATKEPILVRNEPVGSTSTIVADFFFRHGVELPCPIAGLLLAGVVTDTLHLTSPTTTARDAEVLARLEAIAGVNAGEFKDKFFASGSVLVSRPPAEAIAADCKDYTEAGRQISVAQIEELGFSNFWERKTAVLEALRNFREERGYFLSCLLMSDVVKQTSLLLVAADDRVLKAVEYPEGQHGIYELKGMVSRKKQLMPYLAHLLAGLRDD